MPERLGSQAHWLLLQLVTVLGQEPIGEQGKVLAPLVQRRQAELDDVQAMVQILAKVLPLALGFEILVRRRDDSHVDRNRPPSTHPFDHALLQHTQEFGLRRQAQVTHLVQEQGPAIGHLKFSWPRLHACRHPFLDPEQFALHQTFRQRGTVQRHKRAPGARARIVKPLGHQFLPGPALAGNQDGDRAIPNLVDLL